VALDAQKIAAAASRPAGELTRRDLVRALLAAGPDDALPVLPELRRQLISAGNPMSGVFWESADATLRKIAGGAATVGEVQTWLEATGTEPASMIGLLVWDDPDERSVLQAEIYDLLVAHLERLLAAGEIDPDALTTGGSSGLREHRRRQEEWMMAPLPDGRVPMWVVLDESDEELAAEWDAAEAEALAELNSALAGLPDRPRPAPELRAAAGRIRALMREPGSPRDLLAACGGVGPGRLPADDGELWLTLAAGIVSPVDELSRDGDEFDAGQDGDPDAADPARDLDEPGDDLDDLDGLDDFADLSEDEESMVALCALDHYDWLAVAVALARGGPGTPAGAEALARYVHEYDPDEVDDQADAAAGMFRHAVPLWAALGAVDDRSRLTPLGWWGIPDSVRRAWQPGSDR
jgi:hypothetical protein